jgi:aminoglycoside phosphotransferase (APT) family kinase protein
VVAKIYSEDRGEGTFAAMQKLWHSSFGQAKKPPGLPQPIEYVPEVGALIMERIEGRPLVEMPSRVEHYLDESLDLIAALHECDAAPSRRRTPKKIIRSVQRKVERIAGIAPHCAATLGEVVQALDAAKIPPPQLVPCHGDFSARNVLVGENRIALIDWDRFQWADPARDVVYFGTWHWVSALRRGEAPDWTLLMRSLAGYRAIRPGVEMERQVGFYVAAALVRIAASLVELWPAEGKVVPQIAAEALRQLR